MNHILRLVCIALPLVCGSGIAMAFTAGVPPHSGPGSVFYGQPEKGGDPLPTQKSQRKQKFRWHQVLPKRSQ